jgi:hypothetical protein
MLGVRFLEQKSRNQRERNKGQNKSRRRKFERHTPVVALVKTRMAGV